MNILNRIKNNGYENHLEQMKDGYLTLFTNELDKKTERGPLSGHSRVAEVETIDGLVNLKLINEDIEKYGIYVANSFFDYEKDKGKVGLDLPAFVHVKQCEWNPNNFDRNIKEPTILAILDYASNYKRPLRRSLLSELRREKHLLSEREIEFNTNWGVDYRCVNKKSYVVLPCYIWNEDLEIKEHHTKESKKYIKEEREKIFFYNAQGIKDLIEVVEKYHKIVRSSEFNHEEAHLVRLHEGIAKVFANVDDPRIAKTVLQNFRLGNVTLNTD